MGGHAFIQYVESGFLFDLDEMYVLCHHEEFLEEQGPLNIARPIQDTMQDWIEKEASDGFTIQFPYLLRGFSTGSIRWFRSCCQGALCEGNMKAQPCAKT